MFTFLFAIAFYFSGATPNMDLPTKKVLNLAAIKTIQFAQKKARHSAFYRAPSKDAADAVKSGHVEAMAMPEFFPNQGGLPIIVDGQILGGIAASGAKSEIDEAIAQAGVDALVKK